MHENKNLLTITWATLKNVFIWTLFGLIISLIADEDWRYWTAIGLVVGILFSVNPKIIEFVARYPKYCFCALLFLIGQYKLAIFLLICNLAWYVFGSATVRLVIIFLVLCVGGVYATNIFS